MHNRPSDRELQKRISEAKDSLTIKQGVFANPAKAMNELNELNIDDSNDIWGLIRELLNEISPGFYKGSSPPQKSYEKAINGSELFAFCWLSEKLGKEMYMKFALKNGRYYYVSLHPHRSVEQEGV
ncbi:MAG: hypothetical protein H0W88_01720 [Parachlamydiaceae bacterium]|nr:hypothetical protein [Parachlamydiaceae bacterium]